MSNEQQQLLIGLIALALLIMFIVFIIKTIFRIIKWFIKTIWYIITGKKKKQNPLNSDDWLTRAQARQEIRFQNSLPPLLAETKSRRKKKKRIKEDKSAISPKKSEGKKGFENNPDWKWDEETQLWRHKSTWDKS